MIILEGTGKVDYLLPILVTTIAATVTADRVNLGIYHLTLKLKRIPFLADASAHGKPIEVLYVSVPCVIPVF